MLIEEKCPLSGEVEAEERELLSKNHLTAFYVAANPSCGHSILPYVQKCLKHLLTGGLGLFRVGNPSSRNQILFENLSKKLFHLDWPDF